MFEQRTFKVSKVENIVYKRTKDVRFMESMNIPKPLFLDQKLNKNVNTIMVCKGYLCFLQNE